MIKIGDLIKDDIDDFKKRIKGGNGSIVNYYFNNKIITNKEMNTFMNLHDILA